MSYKNCVRASRYICIVAGIGIISYGFYRLVKYLVEYQAMNTLYTISGIGFAIFSLIAIRNFIRISRRQLREEKQRKQAKKQVHDINNRYF